MLRRHFNISVKLVTLALVLLCFLLSPMELKSLSTLLGHDVELDEVLPVSSWPYRGTLVPSIARLDDEASTAAPPSVLSGWADNLNLRLTGKSTTA